MPVNFSELESAHEFASIDGGGESHAYLCTQTGKIYLRSDIYEDPDEELPEDLEDGTKYIEIPDKRDLDLGKPLVLDFAGEFLPDDFDEVRDIFSKRGAYANFKSLLVRRNALERWYRYQDEATKRALREWCEVNSIEIAD